MRAFIRIICCAACLFVGYIATMVWVNLSEGKDAFEGTPLRKIDAELAKKAVDFTGEQVGKLKASIKAVNTSQVDGKEEEGFDSALVDEEEILPEKEIEILAEKKAEVVQVKKAKPTTEDALEKLWGSNEKTSIPKASTVNTKTRERNADASLMNSLERLMN